MDNRTWSVAAGLLALTGVAGVAAGAWLPWLTVRPGYRGPAPGVGPSAVNAGLAGLDWLALVAAVVGLLGVGLGGRLPVSGLDGVRAAAVAILAGGLIAMLPVLSLLSSGFLDAFVPAAGFYLTVLGGVHVSVGGVFRLRAVVGE